MAELDLKYKFDRNKNQLTLYNHRMITTSLYYNAFMQETVLDSGSQETIILLSKAATDCTLTMLTMYFNEHPEITDRAERLKVSALLYQGLGYGLLNLDNLNENGGEANVVQSNIVEILKTKFNKNENTLCHYTNGFILGCLSSVFQKKADFYKIANIYDYKNYGYKVLVEEA
jgi:hypothetical protein